MYLDNLTIAGLLITSLYALVPLLFGKETLRVEDDQDIEQSRSSRRPSARETRNGAPVGNDLLGLR